jgi:hypothetical protein
MFVVDTQRGVVVIIHVSLVQSCTCVWRTRYIDERQQQTGEWDAVLECYRRSESVTTGWEHLQDIYIICKLLQMRHRVEADRTGLHVKTISPKQRRSVQFAEFRINPKVRRPSTKRLRCDRDRRVATAWRFS